MSDQRTWADDLEDGFHRDGFLAAEMSGAIAFIREGHSAEFGFAQRLNQFAHSLYASVAPQVHRRRVKDPVCLGIHFMPRALANFQGAVVLLERGMAMEARTLIRSIYEAGFWMLFLAKKPEEAATRLLDRSLHSQKSVDGIALRYLTLEPDERESLSARYKLGKKGGKLMDIKDVAEESGYGAFYLFYSELSGGAAHGSLKSLAGYIATDNDGQPIGHQIGPDYDQVSAVAKLAFQALLLCIEGIRQVTDHSAMDVECKALTDEFHAMTDGGG
jgi:Family of unknown function (DUF5677)